MAQGPHPAPKVHNVSEHESDLGFTYRAQKNGRVTILHKGKLAATLKGERAVKFLGTAQRGSFASQQQLMARWTGNYKHGNERTARNVRRNSRD